MDSVRLFLLLLLGSLSAGGEIQNNELLEQSYSRAEAVNVEQPQPCLSDLHAVLRDISVKLALLQTKVDALDQLQTKVETIHNQNQVQAAELESLKTWANITENHVDSLWRDRSVGRVAFSAALSSAGLGYVGPFNTDTNLVFRHVFTNIGKAYNPSTGLFTAPVRGIYHFDIHNIAVGSTGAEVWLVKNEEQILAAEEHPSSGWGAPGNGVTLQLEVGDVIFLRLRQSHRIYDNSVKLNTFSGRLLFPM